jgi:hypothetical protein
LEINLKVNNFAKIKHINSFNLVEYYSVCLEEDEDVSLFEQFVAKHTKENKEKLNHILSWIKWIGNKYTAKADYFRNEAETADTSALPPNNPNWEPNYIEWNNETQTGETNNLRLYTFRANDHVVFLFSGDVKTADTAQNCPNVKSHFKMANTLTRVLEQCFRNHDIKWNEEQTDIEFEDDLELNW